MKIWFWLILLFPITTTAFAGGCKTVFDIMDDMVGQPIKFTDVNQLDSIKKSLVDSTTVYTKPGSWKIEVTSLSVKDDFVESLVKINGVPLDTSWGGNTGLGFQVADSSGIDTSGVSYAHFGQYDFVILPISLAGCNGSFCRYFPFHMICFDNDSSTYQTYDFFALDGAISFGFDKGQFAFVEQGNSSENPDYFESLNLPDYQPDSFVYTGIKKRILDEHAHAWNLQPKETIAKSPAIDGQMLPNTCASIIEEREIDKE